jgi:hypothetical protein
MMTQSIRSLNCHAFLDDLGISLRMKYGFLLQVRGFIFHLAIFCLTVPYVLELH